MVENEYTLTIFTPTYNRAYILDQLYKSLLRQTSKDFYWLIVDDGSTDNTEDMVKQWMQNGEIEIEYHRIKNSGKAAAMNIGLDVASGQLFFCVDSDDYLSDDAVEKIVNCYKYMGEDYIGILAEKYNYKTGQSVTNLKNKYLSGTLGELYKKGQFSGDTALIYRTEIIAKYRYPYYENEKFVPDSYLYDLLDQEGELFVFREPVYWLEYMEDGYTGNIKKLIFKNPNGYYAFISQRLSFDKDNKSIFFDNIRCVSINIVRKNSNILEGTRRKWFNFIVIILAYIYYFKEFYRYKTP